MTRLGWRIIAVHLYWRHILVGDPQHFDIAEIMTSIAKERYLHSHSGVALDVTKVSRANTNLRSRSYSFQATDSSSCLTRNSSSQVSQMYSPPSARWRFRC